MLKNIKKLCLLGEIKKELAVFLKTSCPLTEEEILSVLERPRHPDHGHLALPLFFLAKQKKTSPQELAKSFSRQINKNLSPILKSCKAWAGFVNFEFQEKYLQNKLESLIPQQQLANFSQRGAGQEHWLVDFASPNVAKHINIGHLRAGALGQALVNLARAFGIHVTAVNHLGDWGSQFGKLLWAYKKWGKEYDFKGQAFASLAELYVRFHKEAEEDEKNLQEARDLFQKLEEGDPELTKLWSYFVQLSLKNYEKYWAALNIKHDLIQGESFYAGLAGSCREDFPLGQRGGSDQEESFYAGLAASHSGDFPLGRQSGGGSDQGQNESSSQKPYSDLAPGKTLSFLDDLKSRLKEKNLLTKSDGAQVVFLNEESGGETARPDNEAGGGKKPGAGPQQSLARSRTDNEAAGGKKPGAGLNQSLAPCLIFKRDGASTYSARDLASLIYRFEKLKADKNIYITGSDQILHFKQIFQVAGKLNPEWREKSLHLNFGMYRFKGGKMSTRQGHAVYLKDILDQAVQRVENIIDERNPDLPNKKKICEQVGVGALVFNDLMNDRIKDVDFEWSKILDFDGQSGPFVQYSLVRAQSLLRKFSGSLPKSFSHPFETQEEKQLAWRLIGFDDAVFQSFNRFKPHILARYLLRLAKEFNRFYVSQKILGQPREADLLLLADLSRRALMRGMEILNVPRPPAM